MNDPTKFQLESDWVPISRGWGVVPLAIGLASLIGGVLLLRAVGWTFAFPFLVALTVGLASLGYGLALLFGRSVTTLDREGGTISRWWGLSVPFWRRVEPLPPASEVVVECSPERLSNRKTYWRISIGLRESPPVTLYVKRVFAGRQRFDGERFYDDVHLSMDERREIFGEVQALATKVGIFLGVPVRNEIPPEMSGAVGDRPVRV